MAELASAPAAELILQLAGGELPLALFDIYPGKRAAKKSRHARRNPSRHGRGRFRQEVEASLGALGFAPVSNRSKPRRGRHAPRCMECTQPSWRAEVEPKLI